MVKRRFSIIYRLLALTWASSVSAVPISVFDGTYAVTLLTNQQASKNISVTVTNGQIVFPLDVGGDCDKPFGNIPLQWSGGVLENYDSLAVTATATFGFSHSSECSYGHLDSSGTANLTFSFAGNAFQSNKHVEGVINSQDYVNGVFDGSGGGTLSGIALTVSAGDDQTLNLPSGDSISTQLSGFYGDSPANYIWQQLSGTTTAITGENTATPTIAFSEPGEYLFNLTVTAGSNSAVDTVKITVLEDTSLKPFSGVFQGNLYETSVPEGAGFESFEATIKNGHVEITAPTPQSGGITLNGEQNALITFKLQLSSDELDGTVCDLSGALTAIGTKVDGTGNWLCPNSKTGSWQFQNYLVSCSSNDALCARVVIPVIPVNGILKKDDLIILDASNSSSLTGQLNYRWTQLPGSPTVTDWYIIQADGTVTPWTPSAQASAFKASAAFSIATATSDQIPPEPKIGFKPPQAGQYQFETTVGNGSEEQSVTTQVIDIAAIVPEQQDNNLAPTVKLKNIAKGNIGKPTTISITANDKDNAPAPAALEIRIRQNGGPNADVTGYKAPKPKVNAKTGRTLSATAKVTPQKAGTYSYIVTASDGKAASSNEVRFEVSNKKKKK